MPTLKNCKFDKLFLGPTRTCPECEQEELEISAEANIFICNFCGAVWQRLKPTMTIDGRLTNLPSKLKRLLKKN